jgi:predicted PurR-regulated permease PerM
MIIGWYRVTNRRFQFWLSVIVLFLVFLFLIRSVLLPFVLGMFAAYFLDPAADKLEKLGLSRTMSTLLIIVTFFLSIILLSVLVVPVVGSQFSGLVAALPEYISALERDYAQDVASWVGGMPMLQAEDLKSAASDFAGIVLKFGEQFASGIFQSGVAMLNVLSLLLITPVVAFYLLRDWDELVQRVDRLLPRQSAHIIREQLAIINTMMAGFIRGQLNVCLLIGCYYAIGLSLVGLKFGIVIGLMTGLLVILPYVGALFGTLTGLAVAFFQFQTYEEIGMVMCVFLLGQLIEGYLLTPRLVGERVGLHPVWVIFGMLAGASLFGFVGVLLAVPVTAVIGVLIRFAISRYLESGYYTGEAGK